MFLKCLLVLLTFLILALCYWPLCKQYRILNSPEEFEARIQEDRTSFPLSNLWSPIYSFWERLNMADYLRSGMWCRKSVDLKIDNSGLPPLLSQYSHWSTSQSLVTILLKGSCLSSNSQKYCCCFGVLGPWQTWLPLAMSSVALGARNLNQDGVQPGRR